MNTMRALRWCNKDGGFQQSVLHLFLVPTTSSHCEYLGVMLEPQPRYTTITASLQGIG